MTADGPREPGGGALPRLLPRPLAPEGTLAGDFLRGRGRAVELLSGAGPDDGGPRAAAGQGRPRLDVSHLGTSSAEAGRRLERIAAGEGVVVTTGQQPLLFLGPLFVLYKALTAVREAERITDAGTPAVAVFWIASDDHDWAEVGRCRTLDTGNELRTLRLEPPSGREGRAVGPTPLPERIEGLVDEMAQALPNSEFVDEYIERLRDAWRPGRTVAEAFAATLEGVLRRRHFAWLDAASEPVRRAGADLVRSVVRHPGETLERLERGAERVREAGYEPQMPPRPGGLPVFVDTPSGRRRVYRRDGGALSVGADGRAVGRERVLERLEEAPGDFSASGELRPVLESWLLPVERTVLGPSEIAYWAQLAPLFDGAGVPVPRVTGRESRTVLEGKVGKVLEKFGAGPEDVRDGGRELAERVTAEGRPSAVDEALREARREVAAALQRVDEAVAEELPGIRSAAGVARHRAFEALDALEDAVDDRVRERHDVALAQIRKAAVHLHPRGEPQERVLSPFYYLARYGEAFVELVARAVAGASGGR